MVAAEKNVGHPERSEGSASIWRATYVRWGSFAVAQDDKSGRLLEAKARIWAAGRAKSEATIQIARSTLLMTPQVS